MNNDNAFQFSASNTKNMLHILQEIRQPPELSDFDASDMLINRTKRWGIPRISALLIWGSSQDSEKQKQVRDFWCMNGSAAALMRLYYYWQEHYESDALCLYCRMILDCLPLHAEWAESWKPWLFYSYPVNRALRELKMQYDFNWDAFSDKHMILPETKLAKRINALVFCVCDVERLCSDDAVCNAIDQMEKHEAKRLLRNILRNYPLISREGVLSEKHAPYIDTLQKTACKLVNLFPEDKYAALIGQILSAHEIPVPEQVQFWSHDFFAAFPPEKRIGYFSYKHLKDKEIFLVQNREYLIIDCYQDRKTALYRKQGTAKPLPEAAWNGLNRNQALLKRISDEDANQ